MIKRYEVELMRTTVDYCTVCVTAETESDAVDKAIGDYIGHHKWSDSDTLEIKSIAATPMLGVQLDESDE